MHEPPVDLSDEALAAGLRTHYGLAVAAVTFLPLGHDAFAWVYRVQTVDGSSYFLKVRTSVRNVPSLLVPRYLQDQGVAPVVAPLPTVAGTLWGEAAGYALILYPFIAGTTGMEQGMTPPQWIAYGAALRRIHATAVSDALAGQMQRERFEPVGVAAVRAVEAHLDDQHTADRAMQAQLGDQHAADPAMGTQLSDQHAAGRAVGAQLGDQHAVDPAVADLAAIWQEQRHTIQLLAARVEALGRRLAHQPPPFVLCHADIHTNNVMLDPGGQVWIVDWDETILAPKERDLMFALGGGIDRALVGLQEERLFLQGYGPSTVDPLALSYYRYAWAVSDICAFAEEVLFRPDLGAISKRIAAERFLSLFQPGRIVSLALASGQAD